MHRQSGFTLIEVMVTVAIIAILAAVAIPNYTDYTRRGKLVEGTAALLAMRTKMEQYYQDNRSYVTPGGAVLDACTAGSSVPKPTLKHFTIDCNTPARTATTYTITATAIDSNVLGIAFTINEANARTTVVTSGSTMGNAGYVSQANCWAVKKGGVC
jgi:type IV pilus assembly protein PilE